MRITLTIESGPAKGQARSLASGQTLTVGRVEPAGWLLPDDRMLSNQHFAVACSVDACILTDLQSRFGTQVNGEAVRGPVPLKDGDLINAGQCTVRVRVEEKATVPEPAPAAAPETPAPLPVPRAEPTVAAAPAASTPEADAALDQLRRLDEPLFAILDGARERPSVFQFVTSCGGQHQSLYEGPKGEILAPFGPYLVAIPSEGDLLANLVRRGWGRSWGVFLTCPLPFKDVRHHLRHFLEVEAPDTRKKKYFRFYDPRVLRVFIPSCTPAERRQFFGPITHYLVEAADGALLRFAPGNP